MYEMMNELTAESRQLTVLRDTLIPRLLSGRTRVTKRGTDSVELHE